MTSPVVVVVDPYVQGIQYAPALRRAGFSPVAVISAPKPAEVFTSRLRPEEFDKCMDAADGIGQLIDRLTELAPIAVVPTTESGIELADALAAKFTPNLANAPDVGRARRHKGEMVSALVRKGVPALRSVSARDPGDVQRWITENKLDGADLVVKPPLSAGTDGVTLVPHGQGWREAMAALRGQLNLMGVVNDEIVVQERATGTEYIVDTFSHDGRHTVTDICRYRKVPNDGSFAVYESIEFLAYDRPGHPALIEYVEQALDALGVRFGAAHSEVMLTADGPRLIETNARIAGGGLSGVTKQATGDSAVDRLVRYLSGDRDIRPDYTLQQCFMIVFFIAPKSGTLSNTQAYDRIRTLETFQNMQVSARDGDSVAATSDLQSTLRLGWVVLADRDAERVYADHARVRAIASEVRVED